MGGESTVFACHRNLVSIRTGLVTPDSGGGSIHWSIIFIFIPAPQYSPASISSGSPGTAQRKKYLEKLIGTKTRFTSSRGLVATEVGRSVTQWRSPSLISYLLSPREMRPASGKYKLPNWNLCATVNTDQIRL